MMSPPMTMKRRLLLDRLDVEVVDAGRDDLGRFRAALVPDPVAGQLFEHVSVESFLHGWS